MNLMIVESPNKIKSLQKYLGDNYKILASNGHIVYLPTVGPNGFGFEIHEWEPKYKIDPKKRKVFNELKKAVVDAEEVIIATDPDREGEAIGDNLITFLKIDDKYKRIRFNEITDNAVSNALKNKTLIDVDLVNSQKSRRIIDRVIGFKLSGLMKRKIYNSPTNPSAGRVQSVALKLVIDRENEIKAFIPKKYFKIEVIIDKENNVVAELFFPDRKENKNWILLDEIEKVWSSLQENLVLDEVKESFRNDSIATPLKQATLYRRATSKLGYSSSQVQSITQNLYEGFGDGGLISYPRTDSTRLSTTFVEQSKIFIKNKFGDNYIQTKVRGISGDQDAHEAIRPTDLKMTPELAKTKFNLSDPTYKLYKLIYEHTLKCLIVPPKRRNLRYVFDNNGYSFSYSTSEIVFDGYLAAIDYIKTALKPLEYKVGDIIKTVKDSYIKHALETKPPARYNDGSLIEKMDNINVGRPSTFSSTIKILKDRDYVTVENKALVPTEFGTTLLNKLLTSFPTIINELYTSLIENQFDAIANGDLSHKEMLEDFWKEFDETFSSISETIEITKLPKLPSIPIDKECPKCGNHLVIRYNKRTKEPFIGCSNFPKCRHLEQIDEETKAEYL